ncbi:alginate export family protein [Alteromonas sp. KUL49]|uniref:alginate export family protein n=1 Tax=Alteromonas sp. KUL49 TaxID=2480798 RepID=UPI00102EECCE|nr:alginate export family protein [Alteromonas sp. KUL49]TAP38963.1 hypothetical protein EYS00_13790 [Alteromonas sp. KUL49]GEA12403.1 hypothetical protein KUL49_27780 [Alteromonas sp. KUL49]
MKSLKTFTYAALSVAVVAGLAAPAHAESKWHEILSDSKGWADLNLRYEGVEQDNALNDASSLTLRTRIGFQTGTLNGFSFVAEAEDSRIVLGQGDYSVGPTGYQVGEYSVIADPEVTEVDQAFLQYKNDSWTVKAGRQVIALDDHRFVGHVGWRQDRQTFDGISAKVSVTEDLSVFYAYVNQRNRIFAEAGDLDSKDHLLNASLKTGLGKFTAYAYLLEVDNDTDNALDTYGIEYAGKASTDSVKFAYGAEYATQTSESGATEYDASYLNANFAATISGITAKIDYEVLGSDDGMYGFATPLATLHKFNGWTDQWLGTPAQGLVDTTFSLSGMLGGGKWLVAYHDFSADEASDTVDDLGSEINVQYTKKVGKFTLAAKYGTFSSEDVKVDTDKLWIWASTRF